MGPIILDFVRIPPPPKKNEDKYQGQAPLNSDTSVPHVTLHMWHFSASQIQRN